MADEEYSDLDPHVENLALANAGNDWSDWTEVASGHSGQESVLLTRMRASEVLSVGSGLTFSFECQYEDLTQQSAFIAIVFRAFSDEAEKTRVASSRLMLATSGDEYYVNGIMCDIYSDGLRVFGMNKAIPRSGESGVAHLAYSTTVTQSMVDLAKGGEYLTASLIFDPTDSGKVRFRRVMLAASANAAWTPPDGDTSLSGGGGSMAAAELINYEHMAFSDGHVYLERTARGVWSPLTFQGDPSSMPSLNPCEFTEDTAVGCQVWLRFPEASFSPLRLLVQVRYKDSYDTSSDTNSVDAVCETDVAAGEWHRFSASCTVPSGHVFWGIFLRMEDWSTGSAVRVPSGTVFDIGGISVFVGGYAPVVLMSGME